LRFLDRPTGEILVLTITFTVCFGILASGALVGVVVLVHPETDVSVWVSRITGILNTMVGLLAGYLAGRTDVVVQREASKSSEESP
jgi:hypothetical protein